MPDRALIALTSSALPRADRSKASDPCGLARTARGSAGETAAVNELSGNLAACLPAGQTLKLKRQDLRLVVAEPLYHLLSR